MKYDIIALVAFCIVAFGGLGYLFVSLTDGINEPIDSTSVQAPAIVESSAPPAGPIVDESAAVVLGSPSITTTEARDVITVNFNECAPGNGSLDFESGSVSFQMQGLDGNDCVVDYTAGDGDVSCRVPSSLGLQRFTITNDTPDMGTINRYCEAG